MDILYKEIPGVAGGLFTMLMIGGAVMLILAMVHYDTLKEEKEFRKHASKRR